MNRRKRPYRIDPYTELHPQLVSQRPRIPRKVIDYQRMYSHRPLAFISEVMGIHLWSKQREIVESVFANRFTTSRSCHAIGKTFLAGVLVNAFSILRAPCKIVTTAPTSTQVERLLWSEVRQIYQSRVAPLGIPAHMTLKSLRFADDWFAVGISPRDPTSFQGFHSENVLVIFDEAPGVRRELVDGANSLMSSGDAHMLWIGNPTSNTDHFADAFSQPKWTKFATGYAETPNFTSEPCPDEVKRQLINREYVNEMREEWGEDNMVYISRVLGDFPAQTTDQLIPLTWVEAAEKRDPETHTGVHPPRYLAIDVAREGDDLTVFTSIWGNQVEWQIFRSHRKVTEIAGEAIRIIESLRNQPGAYESAGVDDIGVGGGVTDLLHEAQIPVIPYKGSERAINPIFRNRRAESWWNVAKWIEREARLPVIPRLRQDLITPKYTYTSTGQIILQEKKEIKKKLLRSPDFGDSLVIGKSVSSGFRLPI